MKSSMLSIVASLCRKKSAAIAEIPISVVSIVCVSNESVDSDTDLVIGILIFITCS
jgi:hypothetical protein